MASDQVSDAQKAAMAKLNSVLKSGSKDKFTSAARNSGIDAEELHSIQEERDKAAKEVLAQGGRVSRRYRDGGHGSRGTSAERSRSRSRSRSRDRSRSRSRSRSRERSKSRERILGHTLSSQSKTERAKSRERRESEREEKTAHRRRKSMEKIESNSRLLKHTQSSTKTHMTDQELEEVAEAEFLTQFKALSVGSASREQVLNEEFGTCTICEEDVPLKDLKAHLLKCLKRNLTNLEKERFSPERLADRLLSLQWVRLQSIDSPGQFVRIDRVKNNFCYLSKLNTKDDMKDATFLVKPGLAPGPVLSFESKARPGWFLKLSADGIALEELKADSKLWRKEACWKVRPPLGKGTGAEAYSFESAAKKGCYIRRLNRDIKVDKEEAAEAYVKSATFSILGKDSASEQPGLDDTH